MCNTALPMPTLEKPAGSMSTDGEEFSGRLVTMANHATLGLMMSIGHRTGLFEALKAAGPVTSQELADRAGLNERYVREWLGAMTTGRIVRSEEHTSELQSLMRISYAVFCLQKKKEEEIHRQDHKRLRH